MIDLESLGITPVEAALGAVWLLLNLITFFLFGLDKRRARRLQRRLSEKLLLTWSFVGGVVGGWIAMFTFRHKTRKPTFFLPMALAGILHGCLAYWWIAG